MTCNTCKFAPRYRNEHPCNRCVEHSLHSDYAFVEEITIQGLKHRRELTRKRMTLGQLLATWAIGLTVAYMMAHVLWMLWMG